MPHLHLGRALLGLSLGLLLTVTSAGPANANHNQWAHCNHPNVNNRFADQYTANYYTGLQGVLYTYQPFVPNLSTQFSLTHLYMFRDNFTPFVEVGWYRGFGPEKTATNSSYYSAREEPGQPYFEKNYEDAPNATPIGYRLQNRGFDDGTAKWLWDAYVASNFTTPKATWGMAYINWARAVSGGEVVNTSGIQMLSWIQPSHDLLNPSDLQWHNWTDAYMAQEGDTTYTCNDPGFFLGYNVRFDNYTISGTNP